METRTTNIIITILAILLIALLGFGGWGYLTYQKTKQDKNNLEKEIKDLNSEIKDLEKSQSDTQSNECTSTLTSDDKTVIEDWTSYTNNKYDYSFKVPSEWQLKSEDDDMLTFSDNTDNSDIEMQFRSGTTTEIGVDSQYSKTSSSNTLVSCEDATKSYFSSDEHKLVWVTFENNNNPHLVNLAYSSSLGASLASDVGEQFDIILKTIEFNN